MAARFYERTLDSFDDDIIVRVRSPGAGTLWFATLDTGFERHSGDPAFAAAAATRQLAIAQCARAIRDNARGFDRSGPHEILREGEYHLQFRLFRHWAMKEHMRDLGHDPDQFIRDVEGSDCHWALDSARGIVGDRLCEAAFRMAVAELEVAMANGTDIDTAVTSLKGRVQAAIRNPIHGLGTVETWQVLDERIAEAINDLGLAPSALAPGM